MTIRALVRLAEPNARNGASVVDRLLPLAMRYGLSSFGPVAVSAAHFIVSLVFLHALSRTDFGLFSFVLIAVPFCLSLNGALLGISVTSLVAQAARATADDIGTHLKTNWVFAAAAMLAVSALMMAIHAPARVAFILGAYGAVMTLRGFARSYAYAMHTPFVVAASDFAYAVFVVLPVATLAALQALTIGRAAIALLAASVIGLAVFGRSYIARQLWPGRAGSLASYRPIWRDMTRWSLMGVVLTEMTANAHAYLVTLISGPGAFALLAVGALLMRPVSLVYSALPDLERPAMARAIAAGDRHRAFRIVKEFRTAIGATWFATVLVAGAVLIWFPHLILKKGYSENQALTVAAIYCAIMAVRVLRTPESVLLQAACELEPLARTCLWSSMVSLLTTLALLLAFGPIASLGGILAGEGLMTTNIFTLSRRWRRSHG